MDDVSAFHKFLCSASLAYGDSLDLQETLLGGWRWVPFHELCYASSFWGILFELDREPRPMC